MQLLQPHGGILQDKLLLPEKTEYYKQSLHDFIVLNLNQRQICDVELLLNGAFSPLQGFMTSQDYYSVLSGMHLDNGTLWPIPICLDVDESVVEKINRSNEIILLDAANNLLAVLEITDAWKIDKQKEAMAVFGTEDTTHPGVNYLFNKTGNYYIGGKLGGFALPQYYDFCHIRHTPQQLRNCFVEQGWQKIIAFQTRNPMHRAHQELTLEAMRTFNANLLIHPVVGMTKPQDIDHYTRVKCYEYILQTYGDQKPMLSLLPLAMRMAGPREALWHAIIRKNYGCTHFIIGRDHAGPGKDKQGNDFYPPYLAQELAIQHQKELEITIIPLQEIVYQKESKKYISIDKVSKNDSVHTISGTQLRDYLQNNSEIPEWFSYPEIIAELRKLYPPKYKQGFSIFFTGLSGSGKSTIANALITKLLATGDRKITLLDGDVIRKNLASELGFSKQHRDLNIQRIGFVASEITKHGGIAICAAIAPYKEARQKVRELISSYGGFVEVYLDTPIEVCEKRDCKGLYLQARKGLISGFTGVDDPYETPENPEIIINTNNYSVNEAITHILNKLDQLGYYPKD